MKSTIIKKTTAVFLATAIVCFLLAGCTEKKPQPEDTIFSLQNAINKADIDGFLQCFDEEWASKAESVLAFTAGKDGMSLGSFITVMKKTMPVISFMSDGALDLDDFPNVDFTILRTDISENTAVVALSGILTWDGYTRPFAANIDMKLEKDVWVVCGVS